MNNPLVWSRPPVLNCFTYIILVLRNTVWALDEHIYWVRRATLSQPGITYGSMHMLYVEQTRCRTYPLRSSFHAVFCTYSHAALNCILHYYDCMRVLSYNDVCSVWPADVPVSTRHIACKYCQRLLDKFALVLRMREICIKMDVDSSWCELISVLCNERRYTGSWRRHIDRKMTGNITRSISTGCNYEIMTGRKPLRKG